MSLLPRLLTLVVQTLRPGVLFSLSEVRHLVCLGVALGLIFGGSSWVHLLGGLLVIGFVAGYLARGPWATYTRAKQESEMSPYELEHKVKRHAIVVGGTSGIGEALGEYLTLAGYDVISGGRSARGHHIDLGDLATVRAFSYRVKHVIGDEPLHLLVLNAGVWFSSHTETYNGLEGTFGVNHVGYAYLTDLLLPLLRRSDHPRLVVTSSAGAYGGYAPTSASAWRRMFHQGPPMFFNKIPALFHRTMDAKLCNVLLAQSIQAKNPWLSVAIAHPGSCFTRFLGGELSNMVVEFLARLVFKSPQGAAQTPFFCCIEKNVRADAIYSDFRAMPLPWQVTKEACSALEEATAAEIEAFKDAYKKEYGCAA